jgi:hypothetical protein
MVLKLEHLERFLRKPVISLKCGAAEGWRRPVEQIV